MVTAEERMRILQMLQEGKINPEAAAQLLEALDSQAAVTEQQPVVPGSPMPPASPAAQGIPAVPDLPGQKARWLHVRVTETGSGRPKVNLRMPISLVNLGLKLGARYSPEIEGMDVPAMLQAVHESTPGPFVDVYDEEDGEHVEIFLE